MGERAYTLLVRTMAQGHVAKVWTPPSRLKATWSWCSEDVGTPIVLVRPLEIMAPPTAHKPRVDVVLSAYIVRRTGSSRLYSWWNRKCQPYGLQTAAPCLQLRPVALPHCSMPLAALAALLWLGTWTDSFLSASK